MEPYKKRRLKYCRPPRVDRYLVLALHLLEEQLSETWYLYSDKSRSTSPDWNTKLSYLSPTISKLCISIGYAIWLDDTINNTRRNVILLYGFVSTQFLLLVPRVSAIGACPYMVYFRTTFFFFLKKVKIFARECVTKTRKQQQWLQNSLCVSWSLMIHRLRLWGKEHIIS